MSTYEDRVVALGTAIHADIPILLWGLPGVGKTSVIEALAAHRGMHAETVIASISDPTDFKGLPREEDGRTVFSPPQWAQNIVDAGGGVVFFDEMSTAPPSVQAALLRPIFSKVVGDLSLPSTTRFIAAANPPEIAADGWDLAAPLANRFLHMEWDVPAHVIADGFMYGWSDVPVVSANPETVTAAVAEAKRNVGGFLTARSDLLTQVPKETSVAGRAWPSPRSWENAAIVLGHARAAGASTGATNMLVAGCVGASAAREFLVWESNLDLPDVEAALKAGGKIALPPTPDKIHVVCASLVASINGNPTKGRCEAAVNGILVAVADAGHRDIAAVALRKIGANFKSSSAKMSPEAQKHFIKILSAMGKVASGQQ